jgi:sarcosine oxidase subunit alpha
MCAALEAAHCGKSVILIDDADRLGGQLVKQTHKFFGSKQQNAGSRGIDIAVRLGEEIGKCPEIDVRLETTAQGIYRDNRAVLLCHGDDLEPVKAQKVIVATGAMERMLPFSGNDLPGVCGAGAVQTLMNLHGVQPAKKVLMVGAGNIGLIVSYQLMQAGVEVAAIVEAAPNIGGYLVHAAKIRRAGVPIMTGYTVKEAFGKESVEGAVIWELDEKWQPKPGTEKTIECDTICLATGLSPLSDLLWQAGCEMVFSPALGGWVAWRDENLATSQDWIYVAGDVAEVEEASSAMVEGKLAGLSAAKSLGAAGDIDDRIANVRGQLDSLRAGPVGAKIRSGIQTLAQGRRVTC